ncbi:unnamed protein product [Rotaria magnacalcarata]|uniref:F-box domain-containing protein n=1 Tax=Rotaria magnacalcarata TaxID=392030 RepID=A0A814KFN7_9BILA|nr:unnamed protein product [Rotaria magnacalcarata]CAF2103906.1 unnamed protein product [Rotaria magnacalcarata]
MERSFIQLNDLPDEILLILLKNLQNAEVLYSLINVNKRLTTIVNDSNFTKYLTLRTFSSNGLLYEFTRTILDRFCLKILPKIHDKIEFLSLESSSMKRILLLTNYPNLYEIGLYDIATEIAKDLFTDINYFPEANECHCHIYSYPYTLTYYHNITNNFPGGLFKYVRQVSLYDEYPFEHDFFLRITQSFPCMEN